MYPVQGRYNFSVDPPQPRDPHGPGRMLRSRITLYIEVRKGETLLHEKGAVRLEEGGFNGLSRHWGR